MLNATAKLKIFWQRIFFIISKTAFRRSPKLENRLVPAGQRIVFGFVLRLRLFLYCYKSISNTKTLGKIQKSFQMQKFFTNKTQREICYHCKDCRVEARQ